MDWLEKEYKFGASMQVLPENKQSEIITFLGENYGEVSLDAMEKLVKNRLVFAESDVCICIHHQASS